MEYFHKILSESRKVWSALSIHESPKVILMNLPETWTDAELQYFCEIEMDLLKLKEGGIHVFGNIKHTVLLSLEKPMTDQSLKYANEKLDTATFCGRHLQLEAVESATHSLLLRCKGLDLTEAYAWFRSFLEKLMQNEENTEKGLEKYSHETCSDLNLIVFKFTSPAAVQAIVADRECYQEEEMLLEPWYEEFHGRLLREFLRYKVASLSPESEEPVLLGTETGHVGAFQWQTESPARPRSLMKREDYAPQAQTMYNLVIVSNLPKRWTFEGLQKFLQEDMNALMLKNNGIQVFRDVQHTALLSLQVPLTESSIRGVNVNLSASSFFGHNLQVEMVDSSTRTLLVDHMNLNTTDAHERFTYTLDRLNADGVHVNYIEPCSVEQYDELGLTVFKFASDKDTEAILSYRGRNDDGEILVLPWYEEFHGPLLREILQGETTRMSEQVARLTKDIADLKETSADTFQQYRTQTMTRHQVEYERLKKEMEKLKSVQTDLDTIFLDVPAYKLRLLADFADRWTGCKVLVLEQEEKAIFYGGKEDCEKGRSEFLKKLQNLADDIIGLPDPVIKVLKRPDGAQFFADTLLKFPNCSADVDSVDVLCAATDEGTLASFKREFENNLDSQVCEIPLCLEQSAQFKHLKSKLESSYLVQITRITTDAEEDAKIQVDGIGRDVIQAASEVERFTNLNRPGSKHFKVRGALQGEACVKWFSTDLDKIKQMIVKNDGEIEQEKTTSEGYTLVFTCRQEVLGDVVNKLNDIKNNIKTVTVDLNKEFPVYADRALIVNGLLNMTTDAFCTQLGHKLQRERLHSIEDFRLPEKCNLPPFGSMKIQTRPRRRGSRQGRPARRHGKSRRPSFHPIWDPILPCTISVGQVTITIKAGDVTQEEVDVAVCPVTSDLNLTKTHFGIDFIKICPQMEQKLKQNAPQSGTKGDPGVIVVHMEGEKTESGTSLSASVVYLAVLHQRIKSDNEKVSELIYQRTKEVLSLASRSDRKSVVFPPMGVGRRFQYDKEVVASAMTSAFSEFLETNPRSLTNIIVAVKDPSVAFHFAQVVKERNLGTTEPPDTPTDGLSEAHDTRILFTSALKRLFLPPSDPLYLCDDGDANQRDTGGVETEDVSEFMETPTDPFEVWIVTQVDQDTKRVTDILLKELRTTFLWHETIKDVDSFEKLSSDIQQELLSKASEKDVILSKSEKGLRLCGQQERVHQVQLFIRDKMYDAVVQQSKQGWKKRQQLGLPVDTDHLPSYWTMCEQDSSLTYENAMEIWSQQGVCTSPVLPQEKAEIEKLMMETWDADKTGIGKDARSLNHKSIQVVKVERLENPELWRVYSQKREQLFNALVDHHTGPGPAECTPVENLQGSRGPVKTTQHIDAGSLLDRDMYPQVNEHYLFHGTKKELLHKIFSQGLDFRLAQKVMLGRGVYAAESPTKSDQYTDEKQSRTSGVELKMFLLRMLLGEPFLHTEEGGTPFARPPCMTCKQRNCDCPNSRLFNSVVDDKRLFREFVVYDQNVCYPEYIITYRRV